MSEAYRTTRRVEFRDTDAAGIVHFSAFFFYMESVEHEFLRQLGLSVHATGGSGAGQLAARFCGLRFQERGAVRG